MNLRILSVESMIVLDKFWLTHSLASAILASHQVGVAFRTQLQAVHDMLLALNMRRNHARVEVARLTRVLIARAQRHDNLARAIYHHMVGLRATTQDPDEAAYYSELLDICFPGGLSVINQSYLDKSGFVESLAEQMKPTLRARLAAVQIGAHNLDELCQEWIHMGRELGQHALERARLQTVHARNGASDAAIRALSVRSHWIQTVQGLSTAVALMGLSDSDREILFAPLLKSIAAAQVRADKSGTHGGETPDPAPEHDRGDVEPDAEASAEPEHERDLQPDHGPPAGSRSDSQGHRGSPEPSGGPPPGSQVLSHKIGDHGEHLGTRAWPDLRSTRIITSST